MIKLKIIHIILSYSKIALLAFTASVMLSGCNTIDYKKAAYSALRHNDCQRNEIEVFCTRSYHREYHEYERTRDELLKESQTSTGSSQWSISKNDSITL